MAIKDIYEGVLAFQVDKVKELTRLLLSKPNVEKIAVIQYNGISCVSSITI